MNLGISHTYVSLTWICGPVTGFVVQPIVGYYSDRCTMRMGRRRPFILVGYLIIYISVMLIGFSADIGRRLGDTKEHCSMYTGPRWSGALVYIVGFWFLDFANYTVQGPARAMMADLSGLTIGVLNIAIVVPQLIIALVAGPLDGAFNKGNTPAFGIDGAFAFICAVLALFLLPKTRGLSQAAVVASGH